jgi:hypothetical protein
LGGQIENSLGSRAIRELVVGVGNRYQIDTSVEVFTKRAPMAC